MCLWIQRDQRSTDTLLLTLRLEDESFIRETYYIHLKVVKNHSKIGHCIEINTVFPL